jgi:hypothetical protein
VRLGERVRKIEKEGIMIMMFDLFLYLGRESD